MVDDNAFYFYFRENMRAMGFEPPKELFGKLVLATSNIALIADYVKKHDGATVGRMIKDIPKIAALGGTAGGVTMTGGATIVVNTAVGFLELLAAFYAGACIGSLTVASCRTYSDFATEIIDGNKSYTEPDFYSVADVSRYTQKYGIAMNHAMQKSLHRNRDLRKNHLKAKKTTNQTIY